MFSEQKPLRAQNQSETLNKKWTDTNNKFLYNKIN
jgi:hypothetical protein